MRTADDQQQRDESDGEQEGRPRDGVQHVRSRDDVQQDGSAARVARVVVAAVPLARHAVLGAELINVFGVMRAVSVARVQRALSTTCNK